MIDSEVHTNPVLSLFRRRVRFFCVLYETRSFTAASKHLGVSQSAVSRVLGELENDLGFSLFERDVRPIRPTLSGEAMYKMLVEELDSIDSRLNAMRAGNALLPALRIGFAESVAKVMSWDIISEVRGSFSSVSVLAGTAPYLYDQFEKGVIDFVVKADPVPQGEGLLRFFLFQEPSVVVIPKNSGLPNELTWKSLEFSGLPMIQYNKKNSGGQLGQAFFSKLGLHFVSRIEVDISALVMDYVSKGAGWALSRPLMVLQHPDLSRKVDIRPMPSPVAVREVYLISRPGRFAKEAEKIANAARHCFVNKVVPDLISKLPWVAPYLLVGGTEPGSRVQATDVNISAENEKVFVL